MSSTVPSWKAELQRRKKEKERANNEADNRMPWKNDFNEPVNVIIISAKDRDPDKIEEKPSSQNDGDVAFHEDSSGVLEEHVTSVKNNPFLKFDQLLSSQQDGPSSPKPRFLRRASGPLSSFDDGDVREEESNLKSRSKSVDNLHFKFQNHKEEEELSNDIVKEKSQGKGIIASLRAKFGKAASVDEFMAIVRRPRSKSQTLYDVQKAEVSGKRDSDAEAAVAQPSVSRTKNEEIVKTNEKKNLRDIQPIVTNTTSISGIKKGEDTSQSWQDSTQSPVNDKEGQNGQDSVSKVTLGSSDSGVGSRPELPPGRFVKKKPSPLSASDLINLQKPGEIDSYSAESNLNGQKESHNVASQPGDIKDRVLVGEDETDFVGKILPHSNLKKQDEKLKPENKASKGSAGDNKPTTVTENGKFDIKRTTIDGKGVFNGGKSHGVGGIIEKPTVSALPSKQTSSTKKVEPEKISPLSQLQKTEHKEKKGIKTTVIAEVKETDSSHNEVQQSNNLKVTSKETHKINQSPDTKKEEAVKASKSLSSGPSHNSTDDSRDTNTSPFAVKLRKVDKSNTAGVRIVKSSKMTSGNVKSPKRTVQMVLQQQVNGEIPVTNIDDVILPEIDGNTPLKQNVNIKRVQFEVIGYNSPSKFPSMLKTNKKDKCKLHIRFDEAKIQTHEYPSLEVAREEYIAEHGDEEPDDEIVKLSENGEDDDEDVDEETKKKTMNNNTSIFSEGLQNITKSDTTDLSAYLGRGPHKKEPVVKPVTRPPPLSSVSSAPTPEPEVVATPLDDGDGFSMGNSSALLF